LEKSLQSREDHEMLMDQPGLWSKTYAHNVSFIAVLRLSQLNKCKGGAQCTHPVDPDILLDDSLGLTAELSPRKHQNT